MATAFTPAIDCNSVSPGFIVPDIATATDFYINKLGFTLSFTWGNPPRFAGMSLGNTTIHLMTNDEKQGNGMAYFAVEDIDALYRFHQDSGVNITEPMADRPYAMRDYHLQDPFGNHLGFGQYIPPATPELPIQRTELSLRMEKRLAALLQDLAAYKKMDIGQLLEETVLHSFEALGEGVASPHTKGQLRHIQELKKKHNIEYDVHASYRFTES